MRKYNKIAMMVVGALSFSSVTYATDNEIESGNLNKELSKQRVEISLQLMKNKMRDAELEGLRKDQEIKKIQDSLDGGVDISNTGSSINSDVDYSVQFDEHMNDEDVLIESNNWDQNVGFIYQDDVSIGLPTAGNPAAALTTGGDDDFTSLLEETMANITEEEEKAAEESAQAPVADTSSFKITGINLHTLKLYENNKEAELKFSYIKNDSFQDIKGSKYVKIIEGLKFNISNEAYFEVLEVNENGVNLLNIDNEKELFIQK